MDTWIDFIKTCSVYSSSKDLHGNTNYNVKFSQCFFMSLNSNTTGTF